MLLVQSMTGLRRGEIQGLRVVDLRFLDRKPHIRVEQQLIYGVPAPPKTPASKRRVPLIGPAAELLARHLQRYPASGEELVFTTPRDGKPIISSYWAAFKQAAALVGLPAKTTPHDLRHHYASVFSGGESVFAMPQWMGHTQPRDDLQDVRAAAARQRRAQPFDPDRAVGSAGKCGSNVD